MGGEHTLMVISEGFGVEGVVVFFRSLLLCLEKGDRAFVPSSSWPFAVVAGRGLAVSLLRFVGCILVTKGYKQARCFCTSCMMDGWVWDACQKNGGGFCGFCCVDLCNR
jgi:hypothetical protein